VHDTIHALYADHFENKRALFLAVRMKETGELAGLVDFYGLRENLRKVSVGCRIREQWWGMDLEAEATRLMVGYLYSETEIEIVTASTMVEDKDSARALEAADFIRTSRGVEEDWGYPEPTIVDKWFC
jgi:ribosomal-protein-alanine N-acetyltransferase